MPATTINDWGEAIMTSAAAALAMFLGAIPKVLGFLVGQVMRATGGKADPKLVNALLRQRIT